jgi:hypothetical protein
VPAEGRRMHWSSGGEVCMSLRQQCRCTAVYHGGTPALPMQIHAHFPATTPMASTSFSRPFYAHRATVPRAVLRCAGYTCKESGTSTAGCCGQELNHRGCTVGTRPPRVINSNSRTLAAVRRLWVTEPNSVRTTKGLIGQGIASGAPLSPCSWMI